MLLFIDVVVVAATAAVSVAIVIVVVVAVLFILRTYFNQLGRFSRSIRIEIVENYVDGQIDCITLQRVTNPIIITLHLPRLPLL